MIIDDDGVLGRHNINRRMALYLLMAMDAHASHWHYSVRRDIIGISLLPWVKSVSEAVIIAASIVHVFTRMADIMQMNAT